MDGWFDGLMDRSINVLIHGSIDWSIDGWMDQWIDRLNDGWMDGSMAWSIDGWIDQMNGKWEEKEFKEPRTKRERGVGVVSGEWRNGWIDQCIDRWINRLIYWWIDRSMDRSIEWWMDGWMDQRIDPSMDGLIKWMKNEKIKNSRNLERKEREG